MFAVDAQIVFPLHLISYQDNQFHCHLDRGGLLAVHLLGRKTFLPPHLSYMDVLLWHGCSTHGTQLESFIQTPENSPQELLGIFVSGLGQVPWSQAPLSLPTSL